MCVTRRRRVEKSERLVVRAGIEPATTCLEGRCSIRLSYRTVLAVIILPRSGVFSRMRRQIGVCSGGPVFAPEA